MELLPNGKKPAQTREEMLQSLIDRNQPRAYNPALVGCVYSHDFFGGCAIGSQLTTSEIQQIPKSDMKESVDSISNLPFRMQKMGIEFLGTIQYIHDCRKNWLTSPEITENHKGLVWNIDGIKAINEAIDYYELDMNKIPIGLKVL